MQSRYPVVVLLAALATPAALADLPTVTVSADNTRITQSCRVVIPPGQTLIDADGNGVIQIAASNVTVEFAPESVLRGAAPTTSPDAHAGYGIRIDGQSGVTLRGVHAQGFLCAILATRADGLTIEDADISDYRRMHLRSTPAAEDGADWLWPHRNDAQEWVHNYGGAICVEDSANVTIRKCRARSGQNGLLLDRVRESKVYDNDCSFLSGWGLAMWRCSKVVVSRNAFDFCIRGYSHGVYNRGQDSAGILFFEQNHDNVIAENSATHGGDGFFGFAGRDAIAENWTDEQRERLRKELNKQEVDDQIKVDDATAAQFVRKGCNDNLIIKNDFSYAAAHGIELTFSFGNRLIGNTLNGNAICGIWGGYSQSTLVAGNHIEGNGTAGYGLERGGINIEHGRGNQFINNDFRGNAVGIHLWGGDNGTFNQRPWGKANGSASTQNRVADNRFDGDDLAYHFRGPGDVTLGKNDLKAVKKEVVVEGGHALARDEKPVEEIKSPEYPVFGDTHPVGARAKLAGRENIIMTEWGPWDHAAPLVRQLSRGATGHVYELRSVEAGAKVEVTGAGVRTKREPGGEGVEQVVLSPEHDGVFPYHLLVKGEHIRVDLPGTLVATKWSVVFFPWEIDPRKDVDGWRKAAEGPEARRVDTDALSFKFSHGGPKDLKLSSALNDSKIGGDHFGLIAKAKIPLTAGRWTIKTLSDDGVRVLVDGKPVIDNWTWHAPTTDSAAVEIASAHEAEVVVEYFELDGFAVLEFDLAPAP